MQTDILAITEFEPEVKAFFKLHEKGCLEAAAARPAGPGDGPRQHG
jgi:hypothetical protein